MKNLLSFYFFTTIIIFLSFDIQSSQNACSLRYTSNFELLQNTLFDKQKDLITSRDLYIAFIQQYLGEVEIYSPKLMNLLGTRSASITIGYIARLNVLYFNRQLREQENESINNECIKIEKNLEQLVQKTTKAIDSYDKIKDQMVQFKDTMTRANKNYILLLRKNSVLPRNQ